jgi:hypothetical protein
LVREPVFKVRIPKRTKLSLSSDGLAISTLVLSSSSELQFVARRLRNIFRHCISDPLRVHGGRAREARSEREQVEEQDEQKETAMSASEYSGAGKHDRGNEKVFK